MYVCILNPYMNSPHAKIAKCQLEITCPLSNFNKFVLNEICDLLRERPWAVKFWIICC